MSSILIAGYGFVGKEVRKLFAGADIYDPKLSDRVMCRVPLNHYEFCMVNVPTPKDQDGSCDYSAVEEVVAKIDAEVFVVRSTIPPGTTELLERLNPGKGCVFQPEYVASSSPYPAPLADMSKHPFIILGGRNEIVKKVRRLYEKVYPPTTNIFEVSSLTAEIIKYAENSFIATKVTFINELYRICQQFGVDYDQVREGVFRLDPRMTEWWTYCQGNGWGGHCLPKDLSAIIYACEQAGYDAKFLKAVVECNELHKNGLQEAKVR